MNIKGVGVFNVTFEPGWHNNWHIHHKGGQILLCTDGEGRHQEFNKPAKKLHPGDVVYIAPEVTHVALEISAENSSNEWHEKVDDDQYFFSWR